MSQPIVTPADVAAWRASMDAKFPEVKKTDYFAILSDKKSPHNIENEFILKSMPAETTELWTRVRDHYRKSRGTVTQDEIARALGITQYWLNRIFGRLDRGEGVPRTTANNVKALRTYVARHCSK